MGWKVKPGIKIAVTAEVLRVKNEMPTLLLIDGVCYRKDVAATEKEKKKHQRLLETKN